MIFKSLIPESMRAWLRERAAGAQREMLVLDRVRDWRVLRRVRPYRPDFGKRRGSYIDRFYIEKFLDTHREDIVGRVAEFESDQYARKFGGEKVDRIEVVDLNEANTRRSLTIDLARVETIPDSAFDCVICTQTLLLIRDYESAVQSLHKMLKPAGVVLVTVPGICPTVRANLIAGVGEDWWRFTGRSAQFIFAKYFGSDHVTVKTYGNVLTATAFMHGLVQEELTLDELEYIDPDFELIVGIRATKAAVHNG
jgi:SAM-dependent methyltransferase